MTRVVSIIAIMCAVLASGCESNDGSGASAGALAGTKWRLSGWSASSLDPARFTITADFSESEMFGTSAVNSYGGLYTATADGAFGVRDLSSTEMAGPDDAMRAEAIYFDLLRQASKYAVVETTLRLRDEGEHDMLIFQAR